MRNESKRYENDKAQARRIMAKRPGFVAYIPKRDNLQRWDEARTAGTWF